MTRKHYVLLAQTLGHAEAMAQARAKTKDTGAWAMAELMRQELARALAADNPQFDRARFIAAWVAAAENPAEA
jgi:hypothetical protein